MKFVPFVNAVKKSAVSHHVYLLAGEEPWYLRRAEQQIVAALVPDEQQRADAVQRISGDVAVSDLVALIDTVPMFAERLVLIVNDAAWLSAAPSGAAKGKRGKKSPTSAELLTSTLAEMPPSTYVIFTTTKKLDKRLKLVKAVESLGLCLEADRERPWTIGNWLTLKLRELGRDFDAEAREFFSTVVSMMADIDLGFLDGELDKLALYTTAKRITRADLEAALSSLPQVSAFAMIDAINAKDGKRALTLLERQLDDGDNPLKVLPLLIRNVRQLWQCKDLMATGVYGRALGQPLGLNPFIAERLAMSAEKFDVPTLRRAFLQLTDADFRLKTGQAGPAALETAIITLCAD